MPHARLHLPHVFPHSTGLLNSGSAGVLFRPLHLKFFLGFPLGRRMGSQVDVMRIPTITSRFTLTVRGVLERRHRDGCQSTIEVVATSRQLTRASKVTLRRRPLAKSTPECCRALLCHGTGPDQAKTLIAITRMLGLSRGLFNHRHGSGSLLHLTLPIGH